MRLHVQELEPRDTPSAMLMDGILQVQGTPFGRHHYRYEATVSRDGSDIVVVDGLAGGPFSPAIHRFDAAAVKSLVIVGVANAANRLANNTDLPCWLQGGIRSDTFFGGSGYNLISPGAGHDRIHLEAGGISFVYGYQGRDIIYLHQGGNVTADRRELFVYD